MSLITLAELKANRPISKSVELSEVSNSISFVENVELPKLIGEELFADLIADPTATANGDYAKLLNGGAYTYNDSPFRFLGLKEMIYDLVTAHYLQHNREVDTPFSQQVHTFANGQPQPVERTNAKYKAYRNAGTEVWTQIRLYLDRSGNYKYWGIRVPESITEYSPNRININSIC